MKTGLHFGQRIKQARLQKGLRLKDVARETGLSVSLISQVENNNTSPSLSTLVKLSNFLGLETGLFGEGAVANGEVKVCRKDNRKLWTSDDDRISYELLNPSLRNKKFEVVYAKVDCFEESMEKYTHEGVEFGLVIKGKIRVELGDNVYDLEEGDSIYFSSTVPHGVYGVDPEGSEIFWINAPPIRKI